MTSQSNISTRNSRSNTRATSPAPGETIGKTAEQRATDVNNMLGALSPGTRAVLNQRVLAERASDDVRSAVGAAAGGGVN